MASLGQHGTSHIHHHIDWAIATVDQASSYNTGPYCSCRLRRLRSLRAYVLSTRAMAASAACSTGHRLIRAKVAIRIAPNIGNVRPPEKTWCSQAVSADTWRTHSEANPLTVATPRTDDTCWNVETAGALSTSKFEPFINAYFGYLCTTFATNMWNSSQGTRPRERNAQKCYKNGLKNVIFKEKMFACFMARRRGHKLTL